jgi:hypothetical protein
MKKFMITAILLALFTTGATLMAQNNREEYLGLPGDNLNLYAVMKLFQQSKTLEEFERNLNDPNNNINNLDLNGDNMVDYIKVFDDPDGDVHNIVLQVAVGPKENQDVAVFTVQRFNNGQVQIQLTGDEELYGKNYIIEPIFDNETGGTPNPGYTGSNITYIRTTPVEIATWPVVRFIYLPSYSVWHSSWYWGYYPNYWHPWRPFSWHYYYGYHYNWNRDYYEHYRRWDYHRYTRWNDFYYTGRRSYSPDVYHRIESGNYKSTYSHPDQRREGEAQFAKQHPDQYRKESVTNTSRRGDNNSRITVQPNGNRGINGNNGNNVNNGNSSRRNSTNVNNRSVNNAPGVKSNDNTRKSSTTVTNRTVVTHPENHGEATTRRSTTTVNRSVNNNAGQSQNVSSGRSNNTQKSNTVNASARRNAKTKSESTVKKETKQNESENRDTNRRK